MTREKQAKPAVHGHEMSAREAWKLLGIMSEFFEATERLARIEPDGIEILDAAAFRDGPIDRLVATAVFAEGPERDAARWIIRMAAPALGAWPASMVMPRTSGCGGRRS